MVGHDVSQLSDDQVSKVVAELERRFRDEALIARRRPRRSSSTASRPIAGASSSGRTLLRSTRWCANRRNAPITLRSSMNSPALWVDPAPLLSRTPNRARRVDSPACPCPRDARASRQRASGARPAEARLCPWGWCARYKPARKGKTLSGEFDG